jgi:hypothetical protein
MIVGRLMGQYNVGSVLADSIHNTVRMARIIEDSLLKIQESMLSAEVSGNGFDFLFLFFLI